jgi:hypothetical protein
MSRTVRHRRSNRETSYTVTETYHGHELETECTVEYDLEPGERAIMYGDSACPGSNPEVQVVTVVVDATGEDITAQCDLDEIAEDILIEVGESERDRAEAEAEDRADARRDR